MQPSKTGFLYVFDRETGEPVWPIEERPVPPSAVPGEQASPTQPPPFAHQGVTEDDIIDFTPELAARAAEIVDTFVVGPIVTPPSIVTDEPDGTRGTLALPGSWGSGNWNTGAFDPVTGLYYAFSHVVPRVYRLADASDRPNTEMAYYSPNRDAPYPDGIPLIKPPWGRITAIDLGRGEHAWQVTNGGGIRDHDALRGLDLPPLGIASRPVALVGSQPFRVAEHGRLTLTLEPRLPDWLFTERETTRRYHDPLDGWRDVSIPENALAFKLLGRVLVVYRNPRRRRTWGARGVQPKANRLEYRDGRAAELEEAAFGGAHAEAVREGAVQRIDVTLR